VVLIGGERFARLRENRWQPAVLVAAGAALLSGRLGPARVLVGAGAAGIVVALTGGPLP
jgi:hypothetical protein